MFPVWRASEGRTRSRGPGGSNFIDSSSAQPPPISRNSWSIRFDSPAINTGIQLRSRAGQPGRLCATVAPLWSAAAGRGGSLKTHAQEKPTMRRLGVEARRTESGVDLCSCRRLQRHHGGPHERRFLGCGPSRCNDTGSCPVCSALCSVPRRCPGDLSLHDELGTRTVSTNVRTLA